MKKFFCVVVFYTLVSSGAMAQSRGIQHLMGKWEAVDSENSSGGIEVADSNKIYLVYGQEKKAISSFKIDFSKSPAPFDFTIKDSAESKNLKSLLQFVNDDLIQWQVFESDIRPAHFTQSGGQMVYLRRKN